MEYDDGKVSVEDQDGLDLTPTGEGDEGDIKPKAPDRGRLSTTWDALTGVLGVILGRLKETQFVTVDVASRLFEAAGRCAESANELIRCEGESFMKATQYYWTVLIEDVRTVMSPIVEREGRTTTSLRAWTKAVSTPLKAYVYDRLSNMLAGIDTFDTKTKQVLADLEVRAWNQRAENEDRLVNGMAAWFTGRGDRDTSHLQGEEWDGESGWTPRTKAVHRVEVEFETTRRSWWAGLLGLARFWNRWFRELVPSEEQGDGKEFQSRDWWLCGRGKNRPVVLTTSTGVEWGYGLRVPVTHAQIRAWTLSRYSGFSLPSIGDEPGKAAGAFRGLGRILLAHMKSYVQQWGLNDRDNRSWDQVRSQFASALLAGRFEAAATVAESVYQYRRGIRGAEYAAWTVPMLALVRDLRIASRLTGDPLWVLVTGKAVEDWLSSIGWVPKPNTVRLERDPFWAQEEEEEEAKQPLAPHLAARLKTGLETGKTPKMGSDEMERLVERLMRLNQE